MKEFQDQMLHTECNTPAEKFGEARNLSYIYDVNNEK
jgi:hypothetical protein